jgi:CRISPR-associated protein (TIGR02710 family)
VSQPRVLIATVGTGTATDLDRTLYNPILKSLRDGEWDLVVLLPSQATEHHAQELRRRLTGPAVEIMPLPAPDQENDVDRCFGHFDEIIRSLSQRGFDPRHMAADFTRGTKAMSAALALAAVRNEISALRYVEGDRDPLHQNNVIADTERVRTVATAIATASRRLDQARAFLIDGDFSAVAGILPDLENASSAGWPDNLISSLSLVLSYARFYSAWDRLDYSDAATQAIQAPSAGAHEWENFAPTAREIQWVRELARDSPKKGGKPLPPDRSEDMTVHARRVMVDLLANGRRRMHHGQFEDANLRAYRIAEMLGQARLFGHGLDSSFLDPQNPTVGNLQRDLEKGGSTPLGAINRFGKQYLTAGREQTFRLLGRLKDTFSNKLKTVGPQVESRNHSILIHGFDRLDALDSQGLGATYDELEALLREDLGSVADDWLSTAHFQNRFYRRQ